MNLEKSEIIKEQITGLENSGDKETLLALQMHIQQVLDRIKESEEKSEKKVMDAGGNKEELKEKTSGVDEKIKDVQNKIEAVNEAPIQKPEIKHVSPQEMAYTVLKEEVSLKIDGENSTFLKGSRFSYDPDTGYLLPHDNLLSNIAVYPELLSKFFSTGKLNEEEMIEKFSTTYREDLVFIPAIVDSTGALIQKGEIKFGKEENLQQGEKQDIVSNANENIEKVSGEPYQEYEKSIMYFNGNTLSGSIKNNTELDQSDSKEMIFSYDPVKGNVLPRQDAWKYASANVGYFIDPVFNYDEGVFSKSLTELVFKPAKVSSSGQIIEKGEIRFKE